VNSGFAPKNALTITKQSTVGFRLSLRTLKFSGGLLSKGELWVSFLRQEELAERLVVLFS